MSSTVRRRRWASVAWPVLAVAPAALGASLVLVACNDEEESGPAEPEPPLMNHGPPNEQDGQMCVVCHTCGDDGTGAGDATTVEPTHNVCASCHASDGSVTHHGGEQVAWDMDCEDNPPEIGCDDCHAVAQVNDACEACHAP